MATRIMAALLALCLVSGAARAEDFDLPGLSGDSQTYVAALEKRFPAGGTTRLRADAEQQAADAAARHDEAAAVAALEQRLGMGETTSTLWLDLATAQLHRAPPAPRAALLAGFQAFSRAENADGEVPALLVMAEALRALGRDAQAVQALEQVVARAPGGDSYKRLLADAQRAAGLAVRRVTVEGEADPPRACISFTVPVTRRADFSPQDWVRLDPPVQGAAVTREGDQLCISGLPSGATVRATLRAGLPAEKRDNAAALSMLRDTTLVLSIPNRAPRVLFDTRLFVLPRGQAPSVTMTTTNLSSVALKLMRLSERNVEPFLRDNALGTPIDQYAANGIGSYTGRVVWEGRADVPSWQPNKAARTALPLPAPLLGAEPGLYALLATPGDGTPAETASVQMILRTDLAPTVWRGADGLTVQVRGYGDARVRPGVKLRLLARNNDVLADSLTGDDGVARFAAPLLHGDGPLAPAGIDAFGPDGDFVVLDLNAAAFDLSDRGVEGAAPPGPLDAFVWLDRGIYRPGETVQVMALLRDDAGLPADIPARITVRRPNGQVFVQAIPARTGDASLHLPVTLSAGAAVGTWTVEVRADPAAGPIGTASFRVDAFVPDRMAVDLGPSPGLLVPGRTLALPVVARFLYGAPGAGLTGKGTATIAIDPDPLPGLPGYRVGLQDEAFAPRTLQADLPPTDAQGRTAYALTLDHAPDSTHPLKADVGVEINDPAGHGSRAALTVKLQPAAPVIGIRPAFADDAVNAGSEAGFDVAAVDPAGRRVALAARLRLVRERPDWRIVMQGRIAHYETVYRDEPLETRDIAIPASGAGLRVARALPFGRYRIEVAQTDGLAATSYRFRAGWSDTDNPDVPDRVDVSAAVRAVPAGGNARIHIAPPFAGEATLLVLTDRVLALRTLDVPAAGADVDVPVDAGWGPGAYVAVHLFAAGESLTGGSSAARPRRAIGLVWVGVDPAQRTLAMTVDAPDTFAPRRIGTVAVHAAAGAWVSLAAVDEGILRLTGFVSPDPAPHFLGRRRLGIDIRDDWGRLIAPAEGEATLLRQGGDQGSFVLPEVPQHTVTLFAGPVQAGADGVASFPLDLPDFNGQVRLMAVGWQASRIGAVSRDVLVRDALVAEPLLPRFLAPGDTTRLAVLLHNLDLPAGEAAVALSTEGPLAIDGETRPARTLALGEQALLTTGLRATGAGRGVLRLDVTGPGGFHIQRSAAITIRPSRGAIGAVAGGDLAPGVEATVAPPLPLDRFIAGTASASVTFGAPVRFDADAMVKALADYPLSCLEQTTSRGLPLTLRPDAPVGALGQSVAGVLDHQRYDGAFGLWSAAGDAEPWLSAYATDFLLRARAAGAAVPSAALDDALKYLASAADAGDDGPEALAAETYRLYVLAEAGQGRAGAARVLAERLGKLPTPLAKAQLAAALALAHDEPRAETAFRAALAEPARGYWSYDYGTAQRDQAAIAVLLRESGLLPDALQRLVASLPGADLDPDSLSTQELAWDATAAAALGRTGAPARIAVGGQEEPAGTGGVVTVALTGPAQVRNLGASPVWQSVSVRGVPIDAPPRKRSQMRVSRQFFTLDGGTLDLDHLTQNTVFILLLEGRAEDGQDHRAMLLQGLPAGWEIAGRLAAGAQEAMPWLGTLSDTEAEPAADDRYAAILPLTAQQPAFRVAVRLRAVTPGNYEIPGAELSDMYRPTIFARQTANRIDVLPPAP